MICKKVAVVKYNELDEIEIDMDTNKVQYNIKEEYSVATKEQDLLILEAENEVLKELNLKDMNEIFKFGKAEVFYRRVYSILKRKANIKYYFNGYKLIYNRDIVLNELEKYGDDMYNVRNELNNIIKEKMFDNAIKRQEKAISEYESDKSSTDKDDYKKRRLSKDYLNIMQTLIENVISLTAKDIRYKLKVEHKV